MPDLLAPIAEPENLNKLETLTTLNQELPATRPLRHRAPTNYTLPPLRSKLRRGDPHTFGLEKRGVGAKEGEVDGEGDGDGEGEEGWRRKKRGGRGRKRDGRGSEKNVEPERYGNENEVEIVDLKMERGEKEKRERKIGRDVSNCEYSFLYADFCGRLFIFSILDLTLFTLTKNVVPR